MSTSSNGGTATAETAGQPGDGCSGPRNPDLVPFWRRLQATTITVDRIAENLETEGIRSYADALRGAEENLMEAFHDLARRLPAVDAGPDDADRLLEVLGVCQAAIGLAADGELENSYSVPPRAVFREVYDYLIPAWDDALQARELDEGEEFTVAGNTLEALAGEAKMKRTVRYGEDVEMEDGELYRIKKVGPGKELAPGVYATTRDGGHRMGTLIEVDESVDRNEFSDYLHAESEKQKRAVRDRVRDQMDRS